MKKYRDMSLIDLIIELDNAKDQETRNIIVMEITYRIYVPFQDKSFEELLIEHGYRPIEKKKKASL